MYCYGDTLITDNIETAALLSINVIRKFSNGGEVFTSTTAIKKGRRKIFGLPVI